MDQIPRHRPQRPVLLDLLPELRVRAVDDEERTVRVGGGDGGEEFVVGDGGDGVALDGADEEVGGAGGILEGLLGVGLEGVAFFVVVGDDLLEFVEGYF